MPQMRPTNSEIDANDPNCRIVTYEGASSPSELLENCVIQAKAALKSLAEVAKTGVDQNCEEETERRRMEALGRTREEQEAAMKAEAEWNETNPEDEQLRAFWYARVVYDYEADR